MEGLSKKALQIADLQQQILQWQGFKQVSPKTRGLGLGELEQAFPGHVFPVGALHEFVCDNKEEEAASTGFIASLLSLLLQKDGLALWISHSKELFAPAISSFGLEPDRIIFVQLQKQADRLWALEEGLKCEGIKVVLAELPDINFVQSRRLQLLVEKSGVTGFLLRLQPSFLGATTCAARWQIRSLPSRLPDEGLPGVGFPAWEVGLLKVKNGQPSSWQLSWQHGALQLLRKEQRTSPISSHKRKAG